jgi:hypothetical protein
MIKRGFSEFALSATRRLILGVAILLGIVFALSSSLAFAQCGPQDMSLGNSPAKERWCTCMGGTYNVGTTACTGVNQTTPSPTYGLPQTSVSATSNTDDDSDEPVVVDLRNRLGETPDVRSGAGDATTSCVVFPGAPVCSTQVSSGPLFPEPPSPQIRPVPTQPDLQKLLEDWELLHLAARVYSGRDRPGGSPFVNSSDWRTMEFAVARALPEYRDAMMASGFEAYAYINEQTKTIAVAIQGSREISWDTFYQGRGPDAAADWLENDLRDALFLGREPPQFMWAREYLQAVQQAYGDEYEIVCTGHSLGGGACARAAGTVGVRAVVINPISAGIGVLPENAHLVENYVVDGEIADWAYGRVGRYLTGTHYRINNFRDSATYDRWNLSTQAQARLADHGVERALDNLAQQMGIERLE